MEHIDQNDFKLIKLFRDQVMGPRGAKDSLSTVNALCFPHRTPHGMYNIEKRIEDLAFLKKWNFNALYLRGMYKASLITRGWAFNKVEEFECHYDFLKAYFEENLDPDVGIPEIQTHLSQEADGNIVVEFKVIKLTGVDWELPEGREFESDDPVHRRIVMTIHTTLEELLLSGPGTVGRKLSTLYKGMLQFGYLDGQKQSSRHLGGDPDILQRVFELVRTYYKLDQDPVETYAQTDYNNLDFLFFFYHGKDKQYDDPGKLVVKISDRDDVDKDEPEHDALWLSVEAFLDLIPKPLATDLFERSRKYKDEHEELYSQTLNEMLKEKVIDIELNPHVACEEGISVSLKDLSNEMFQGIFKPLEGEREYVEDPNSLDPTYKPTN